MIHPAPVALKNSFPTWACVLSPMVLLITIVALAIHIRIGLGHWPQPMIENYKTTAFKIHDKAVDVIGIFSILGAIPLWSLLLFFRTNRISIKIHAVQFCVYLFSWLLIIVAGHFDPTSFTEWFLD